MKTIFSGTVSYKQCACVIFGALQHKAEPGLMAAGRFQVSDKILVNHVFQKS